MTICYLFPRVECLPTWLSFSGREFSAPTQRGLTLAVRGVQTVLSSLQPVAIFLSASSVVTKPPVIMAFLMASPRMSFIRLLIKTFLFRQS